MAMDYISSTNIFSISSCDLNTKYHERCHSDWSKTNLIAVVTQEGINILQPHLERASEPFNVQLIANPRDKFKHAPFERNNITLEGMWGTLDNKQYMETFLDPALLTIASKLSLDSYPRRFRSAKWSPVIKTFPAQCLLTTISVDFQLAIYYNKDGVWVMKENLSQIYDDLWEQTILASSLADISYNNLRKNLHSVSFNSVCWKEHDVLSPLLLSSTLTGDIVIWSVNQSPITDDEAIPYKHCDQTNFSVVYIVRTNQDVISDMKLYKNLLIATSRNGQVDLYDLNLIFEEIEARQETQQVQGYTRTTLAITESLPTAILWHHDNIEVLDFYLKPLSQDTFRIVLSKSTNICWCTIHYKPKTSTDAAVLAISDSFSAINGLDPEVSLHQTPATWLKPAGDNKAILIADDGSFFQLDFIDDRHDTSPSFNAIRTGKIDLTDMIPRGLCTSPNGALITMISCATYLIDPLKIPSPAKLILLPTINERKFFIECMQTLLDENWLYLNHVTSPMDIRDRIDCIRSMFPQLNPYQYDRLRMMLKEEITAIVYPKTGSQLVLLKIIAFLLLKLNTLGGMKLDDDSPDNELEKSLHDMIYMDYIEKILDVSFKDDTIPILNDDQVRSLRNIFRWLETSSIGQAIRERYRDSFDKVVKMRADVPLEMCSCCLATVEPLESLESGVCTNNHKFSRCPRSLLVITGLDEQLQCQDCGRFYLARLVWPTDNLWLCVFCQ